MDGYRGVPKHSFWTGRCYNKRGVGIINQRIANMIQLSVNLLMFDFDVGEGSQASRAPVDQSLTSVNQAFLIQTDEHLLHGCGQTLVHGEPEPGPVTGGAQSFELFDDRVPRLLLPGPYSIDKGLSA